MPDPQIDDDFVLVAGEIVPEASQPKKIDTNRPVIVSLEDVEDFLEKYGELYAG